MPRPLFCNLSLCTKHRGLYAGCDNFSLDYTLLSGKAWPHCWWGVRPSARWRDAPNASSRLTSFSTEGRGSRALPRSSWHVHRWCGRSVFAVDISTVDNQVAVINISTAGWVFFWVVGWGAYAWDKIPQQDFVLKIQWGGGGGGGLICGTLRYLLSFAQYVHNLWQSFQPVSYHRYSSSSRSSELAGWNQVVWKSDLMSTCDRSTSRVKLESKIPHWSTYDSEKLAISVEVPYPNN